MSSSPSSLSSVDALPTIPAGARLVHIGPHKTGSSAVQTAMHTARDVLGEHDVHYAGRHVRPRKAVWSLGVRGRPAGSARPDLKYWHALLNDIASAGPRRVCLSNEDLGRAEPDQIRRVVDDLGGADRVHVVAVARRFDRYLPSQWQERVKAGESRDYDTWLQAVLADLGEPVEWGMRGTPWERINVQYAHDPLALATRWSDVVGRDRFTLVVSDEGDRGHLLRVFEQLLGLPAQTLAQPAQGANQSLAWAEVEAVAAINAALEARGVSRIEAKPLIGRGLARALKERGAGVETGRRTPPLPGWAGDVISDFMNDRIASLREFGVRVVGDLERLRLPKESEPEVAPTPRLAPDDAAFMVLSILEASGYFAGEPSGAPPDPATDA